MVGANTTIPDIYQRQQATWSLLPDAVKLKILKDTRKRIQKLMRANGFLADKESRVALTDPNADEYLGLQISGDEFATDDEVLEDAESLQGASIGCLEDDE